MATRILPRILGCLLLAGCTLIDQNTFAPAPEARAQTAPAAASAPVVLDGRTPLMTIDYSGAPPQYEEMLRYAVHAAERRDRDVQYDLVAVLPKPDQAGAGQTEAVGVMRTMMQAGVPAGRIHLALRADPSLDARQVRIYVR